jgi:hypothetical protein
MYRASTSKGSTSFLFVMIILYLLRRTLIPEVRLATCILLKRSRSLKNSCHLDGKESTVYSSLEEAYTFSPEKLQNLACALSKLLEASLPSLRESLLQHIIACSH